MNHGRGHWAFGTGTIAQINKRATSKKKTGAHTKCKLVSFIIIKIKLAVLLRPNRTDVWCVGVCVCVWANRNETECDTGKKCIYIPTYIRKTANAHDCLYFSSTGKQANVLPILHEPATEKKSHVIWTVLESCFYFNFINKFPRAHAY